MECAFDFGPSEYDHGTDHYYRYCFAINEGGEWLYSYLLKPPEKMLEHLKSNVIGKDPQFAAVVIGHGQVLKVFSVRFPDDRIWDVGLEGWTDEVRGSKIKEVA